MLNCCPEIRFLESPFIAGTPNPTRIHRSDDGTYDIDVYSHERFVVRLVNGIKFCPFCGTALSTPLQPIEEGR